MIAEELVKSLRASATPEQKRAIFRLERTLKRLILETNSVLLTGKFEAGLLNTSTLKSQLNDFVSECLAEMRTLIENSGRTINFEPQDSLNPTLLDPALFPSVLNNLIDNALKYGEDGSAIEIKTHSERNEVVLTVSSVGQPLESSDVPKLFSLFSRGNNSGGKPGSGLGLYIVRQIVESHGGKVNIKECGGLRTSIEIRLPAQPN